MRSRKARCAARFCSLRRIRWSAANVRSEVEPCELLLFLLSGHYVLVMIRGENNLSHLPSETYVESCDDHLRLLSKETGRGNIGCGAIEGAMGL